MSRKLGSVYLGGNRCSFTVWAPQADSVDLVITSSDERIVSLGKKDKGYYQATVDDMPPGSHYFYRLDGNGPRPDPASCFQPHGVHGPSEVMDARFDWNEGRWNGIPLDDYVIYELHVGTFTPGGDFTSIIDHLEELKNLGVTAIELMPVAQFPGSRNWGYDGVHPFAVQNSYGGPRALKELVAACHRFGLAVILDVVYNHLGPEGNYLREFAPYFTDRYKTPWGSAINFDGPESDEVRRYFIENALYWIEEFHVDALRLDAVHAICDFSARTFIEDLEDAVHRVVERERPVFLIAECNRNDVRLIRHREYGGYGLDAQWNDDFHHSLHTLLTGEREGYYQDFGEIGMLEKAFREGFVYSGQYSPFRRRRHGSSSRDIPGTRMVVCSQNHDQIGNRMLGERLVTLVSFEAYKLAAGAVILSPFLPLLFMGEEYGESAPFTYFISHSDTDLIEAVRQGRREEFADFSWKGDPPDPQSEATFRQCLLDHDLKRKGRNHVLYQYYRELLRLRNVLKKHGLLSRENMRLSRYADNLIGMRYLNEGNEAVVLLNFDGQAIRVTLPDPVDRLDRILDSSEERHGPGLPGEQGSGLTDSGSVNVEGHSLVLLARLEQGAA
jgi:maltooligosyltrehalose trehalohydrolase